MTNELPDRQNSRVWFMLVIVSMALALVGWYRYFR
jgi:hypothetical protein